MADHEHEIVTHLFHVKVPYHLTPQEIEFEQYGEDVKFVTTPEMLEELASYKDDEIRRVIAGTALLLEKYPHRELNEALHTAMVWERG